MRILNSEEIARVAGGRGEEEHTFEEKMEEKYQEQSLGGMWHCEGSGDTMRCEYLGGSDAEVDTTTTAPKD